MILSSVHSQIYKCADELEQGGVCRLETEDPTSHETIYYVKKCGKGKRCYSTDDDTLGGCYKMELNELGEEDDKCKVNEECYSQNCVSGKCKYVADGAECSDSEECKPTSYCSSGKCKAFPKPGEECADFRCMNGYVCTTTGTETVFKCTAQYSVDNGGIANNPLACKSGFLEGNKCISYTLSSTECDASGNCSYKSGDTTKTFGGYCDTKSDGKTKACRDINGDLWNKYVEAYGKRLNKIKDDKDYNRHSSKWSKHLGDRDVSDAYVEWEKSILFADASKCVKDYFKDDEASSNFVAFNVMIMISFALILI